MWVAGKARDSFSGIAAIFGTAEESVRKRYFLNGTEVHTRALNEISFGFAYCFGTAGTTINPPCRTNAPPTFHLRVVLFHQVCAVMRGLALVRDGMSERSIGKVAGVAVSDGPNKEAGAEAVCGGGAFCRAAFDVHSAQIGIRHFSGSGHSYEWPGNFAKFEFRPSTICLGRYPN